MKIAIVGAGGHGRVILDILRNMKLDVARFVDDSDELQGKKVDGVPVLCKVSQMQKLKKNGISAAVIGIGNNDIRAKLFKKTEGSGFKMINAVHPNAVIAKTVKTGKGNVIMAGVVANTGTRMGDDAVINTGAVVDHDNVIGKHAHIFPGAKLAGTVTVGEYSYIGTGASVINNINIGKYATVGAGAAVIEDVPDYAVVVGVPAKVIKYREEDKS